MCFFHDWKYYPKKVFYAFRKKQCYSYKPDIRVCTKCSRIDMWHVTYSEVCTGFYSEVVLQPEKEIILKEIHERTESI